MKKILLLDAAFSAIPIYEYLVRTGYQIWVMGNRETDPLAKIAGERWINQDYSDVSAVKRHIENLNITHVLPGCTDVSIETCLQLNLNNHLLDELHIHNKLANKEEFRKVCAELDLPSPKIFELSDFPIGGKYICKPVDSFSGKGINIVDGFEKRKLADAYQLAKNASATSCALIENYISGQLYSFSAFIESCIVKDYFIVKEGSSVNPYAVDTSYLVDSLDFALELKAYVEKLSSYLDLKDGLLHIQFILDESSKTPYFIEVARRCPGDLYSKLIEYSTGYTYAAKYASYFIEEKEEINKNRDKLILRHTVSSDVDTTFKSLIFSASINVLAFYPLLLLGDNIKGIQKVRVGLLFTESTSIQGIEEKYAALINRELYSFN
ncbi:hypothetical protein MGA5115_03110 [Marinomonas gallaica]|uniref:ATP-grasp domain-containing protein n=1 Tax=Marinomonas gallaica TaxID=1806667 RepID=A0A1C3JV34_9GAMM|nr:hypothetical protein [Marinomonas gallaica]SBT18949.1 hypothetical protein MGA5115_03110 [Marinomonas gallaica]SBT21904.1 hypothetical protein MGA5116_02514 [Marinomonas gallaica]